MNDGFEARYGDTMRRIRSGHSVAVTLDRVETAVRRRGLKFFGRHDHAAAAREYGLELPPTTVFVFGNPTLGTPSMLEVREYAIEAPPRGLVYEDDAGEVWIAWNTAEYLFGIVYPRHGLEMPREVWAAFNDVVREACEEAAG